MVLLCDVAASTGLFGGLPGSAEAVATGQRLDPHAVRVVLDALTGWGIVVRGTDGTYAKGEGFPGQDDVASIRHHARSVRRWAAAVEPRLRGEPQVEANRLADPEPFHDALAVTARRAAPEIVDACLARFPDARSVLDLGGLHGEYALEFTRRGLQATMQDQPGMIDVARRRGRLEAAGVTLFEGSFFEAVPEGPFDLAFCSGITHTFDGARNLTLYRNLRPVVATAGGVAVVTFLRHRHPITSLFAVQMLLNDNGGDTHTEQEYRQWLGAAGFAVDDATVDLPGDRSRTVLFAT